MLRGEGCAPVGGGTNAGRGVQCGYITCTSRVTGSYWPRLNRGLATTLRFLTYVILGVVSTDGKSASWGSLCSRIPSFEATVFRDLISFLVFIIFLHFSCFV